MTPIAITFLVLSILIIWGGLVASVVALARRPERADYPEGAADDQPHGDGGAQAREL